MNESYFWNTCFQQQMPKILPLLVFHSQQFDEPPFLRLHLYPDVKKKILRFYKVKYYIDIRQYLSRHLSTGDIRHVLQLIRKF